MNELSLTKQRNATGFINSITQQRQVMWDPKQLINVLGNVTNLRDRAFMSFLYLTACRKGEPLPHRKKIKVFEMVNDVDGRKNKEWTGKYRYSVIEGFRVNQIIGVNRYNKAANKMMRFVDFQNLYVGKTRLDPLLSIRTVPVNVELYREFLQYIFDYIRAEKLDGESVIFKFSSRTATNLTDKSIGVFPHFLRHLRLTHLKILHGYDAIDLMRFVRWKDTRPADVYVHLDPRDLALKQL